MEPTCVCEYMCKESVGRGSDRGGHRTELRRPPMFAGTHRGVLVTEQEGQVLAVTHLRGQILCMCGEEGAAGRTYSDRDSAQAGGRVGWYARPLLQQLLWESSQSAPHPSLPPSRPFRR